MDATATATMKRWLAGYVRSFRDDVEGDARNYRLKAEHTARVRREILGVGRDLGLGDDDLRLAEIAALGHDVGRFAQYRRWRTFSDAKSTDHAALGAEILAGGAGLDGLSPEERATVLDAVRCHNRARVPDGLPPRTDRLARLLRDADKLDIWRVLGDYYRDLRAGRNGGRNEVVEHGLPDTPGANPAVLAALAAGRCVDAADVRSINDWKLMQVGWVYDVNFLPTLRRIRDRGILGMLRGELPGDAEVEAAVRRAIDFVEVRR